MAVRREDRSVPRRHSNLERAVLELKSNVVQAPSNQPRRAIEPIGRALYERNPSLGEEGLS